MASDRLKRPRDVSQRAKLIVEIATGEVEDRDPEAPQKDQKAAELGKKGGAARAKKMTPKQRKEIAQKAAASRWKK